MAVDNGGHQRCKSSTGWVQDAGTGWDTDAKRGTPGEDGSNFGVINLAGGVNPDAVYSASWSGDCSSLATSNLSGQTNWSPAAATMGNGAHYVVTGTDSAAYQYIPATGWQSLGGTSVGTPGAVSWDHNNRLDVFVRGSDNAMYHKWWDGTSWSVWESLGGTLTSGPGCTSWGTGRIDCFVIGQGGSDVYHKFYSSGWSAWENLT